MVMVEAVVLVLIVGVAIYGITTLLLRPPDQPHNLASLSGTWRVAHYDADGTTHVVLQKIADGGARVLDEHEIATVRSDDPEYDTAFLAAMDTARQRQALFETEEGA